jgi:dihydrolipoamide dehydrogenase
VSTTFDVIILGGGPAGYVCAIRCAQLGLQAAVVEREKLGGVCVNIGCIPSKALLHSAMVANLVRHDAKALGITTGEVTLDYGVAMKRSRQVAEQNSKGVEFLMKKNKVTVVAGTGTLEPGRKVRVGNDVLTASKAVVVATGSRVKGLPQAGLEINRTSVISTDEALFLEQAPQRLAIVGAGAVGMEFADIFNAFGSEVTLIEVLPRILPLEDAESSAALARVYKKRGITILAGARVKGAKVAAESVTLEVEANGTTRSIEVDKVLMAAGRGLNVENIGLEAAGVTLTDRGFVRVDANLRTTAEGVYAIGDIAGPPMLAHKGSREGVFVAEVIARPTPSATTTCRR